jgi:hypothetical protein
MRRLALVMRRLALVICAACAMVAAALPAVAVAQATPTHTTFSFPVEFVLFNPCNGETIVFSGRFSGEVTMVQDAGGGVQGAGGGIHFTAHQLLSAQGQGDFGNRYSFTDSFSTATYLDTPDSAPFTSTQVTVDRGIGQGEAPNFVLTTTIHTTVSADGRVTAAVFRHEAECR